MTKETGVQLPATTPTTITQMIARARIRRKRRTTGPPPKPPPIGPPASSTRSRTLAATRQAAPPAMNTRSKLRVSQLQQPTQVINKKIVLPELAAAVTQRRTRRKHLRHLTRRITHLENEVHQALAVMDTESGKLLNYRQLMKDPKYQKVWGVSSANKFGRLANGVGGRIKGTNTIKFIHKHEVPKERMKDVTYGQFACSIQPEKAKPHRT